MMKIVYAINGCLSLGFGIACMFGWSPAIQFVSVFAFLGFSLASFLSAEDEK